MTPRLLHYSNTRVKWRYNNISKEVESSLIKINRHPFYIFCLLNYISWLCCLYFCLLDVCIGLVLMCVCLGGCMAEDTRAQPLAVTPASASQELCSPASLLTSLCLSLLIEKIGMTTPNTGGVVSCEGFNVTPGFRTAPSTLQGFCFVKSTKSFLTLWLFIHFVIEEYFLVPRINISELRGIQVFLGGEYLLIYSKTPVEWLYVKLRIHIEKISSSLYSFHK